jgi:MbtH protein
MSRLLLSIIDASTLGLLGKYSQQPVDGHRYRVVTNEEGQYALWQFKLAPPSGWITIHSSNSQEECLKFIDNNWLNIMPKSFQK